MKKKKNIYTKKLLVIIPVCILLVIVILFALNKINDSELVEEDFESATLKVSDFKEMSDSEKIKEIKSIPENDRNYLLSELSDEDVKEIYDNIDRVNQYDFDKNRLKLEGSAEYEGPDFESGSMEFGTYTSLKIRNISDQYLESADITLLVNGENLINIKIEKLPSGKEVLCVGRGYKGFSKMDSFEIKSCKSKYKDFNVNIPDGLSLECNNRKIVINNNSDMDMSGYTFIYKGRQDDLLLGGINYSFVPDSLKPGETYTTESECIIGTQIEIVDMIGKGE